MELMSCQAVELSSYRAVELWSCRSVELSSCRADELSICQAVELMSCRAVELSIYRDVELSSCGAVEMWSSRAVELSSMTCGLYGACFFVSAVAVVVVLHDLSWKDLVDGLDQVTPHALALPQNGAHVIPERRYECVVIAVA